MNSPNGIGGEMGGLIKIETITPAMARALLERDSKNRPIRKRRVDEFATEMRGGTWQLNGETIKIAVNGDVLDGQHRLCACVQSNTSFQTVIVYDLPTDVFKTIDNGSVRTLADLLHLRSVEASKTIASAAAYVMRWDSADPKERMTGRRPGVTNRPTRNQLFNWLETTNFTLWPDSARAARRVRGLCPRSIACASHYIMSRSSRAKADDFFTKFATGAGLSSDGDPVLHLRNRFIKDKTKKFPAHPEEKFAWIMKAWVAFLEGREMRQLRVRTKGKAERIGALRDSIERATPDEYASH